MSRRRVLLLAVLGLLLAAPGVLWAHQSLRWSAPAKDARLAMVPASLRLRFAEPVNLDLTRVLLIGPAGDTVALAPLERHADSTTVVWTGIRGSLAAGAYRVRWITAGADGHPTSGEYQFEILPGAAGLDTAGPAPATSPVDTGASPVARQDDSSAFTSSSPLYVALRWLLYAAIVLAVGSVVFRVIVLGVLRRAHGGAPRWFDHAGGRAAGAGLAAALILAAGVALRLWAQSAAMRGAGLPADAEALRTTLATTPWGWGWLLQLLAAAILIAGFALARKGRMPGWPLAAVGALLVCLSPALSGHAAASERSVLAIAADATHVMAAGGWLGGLALVMVAGLPAVLRLDAGERGRTALALVNAFSPVALTFGALIAISGVTMAWVHLGSVAALWSTGYGRTLIVKLLLLIPLGAVAAFNWRRVRPRLATAGGTGTLRTSAAAELALACAVLAVTAVLVATPIE